MKYRKASDIFPDELLKEIQKYSSGELVYIPKATQRKSWGAESGALSYYHERNSEIRRKFHQERRSMEELADEYNLSAETLKKIIYR